MTPAGEKVKDPVCHMWVAPDQNAMRYQGMDFAFCSRQCRDRFMVNPHRYIGEPGLEATTMPIEKFHTWFGLKATVEIKPGHWHRAGYGNFLLPHPPVANWLLRRGLSTESYVNLSVKHEVGHLTLLPIELLYI